MNEFMLVKDDNNTAAEINKLHQSFCDGLRTSLETAIKIGGLLIKQKEKHVHGGWLSWIETNLNFDRSTAAQYMRCFNNKSLTANVGSRPHLAIKDAARTIAKPSDEEIKEKKMLVEAKSKRNASRIVYAKKHAISEVLEALEDGSISIDAADQIARAPKDVQLEMLETAIKRRRVIVKPKAKPVSQREASESLRREINSLPAFRTWWINP